MTTGLRQDRGQIAGLKAPDLAAAPSRHGVGRWRRRGRRARKAVRERCSFALRRLDRRDERACFVELERVHQQIVLRTQSGQRRIEFAEPGKFRSGIVGVPRSGHGIRTIV